MGRITEIKQAHTLKKKCSLQESSSIMNRGLRAVREADPVQVS